MYFTDVGLCPVAMFELYILKINTEFKPLWQKPKQGKIHCADEIWYNQIRAGHDPLETFIKRLSLSQDDYTNHCVRATVIDTFDENDFKAKHMMAISGHKFESSLCKYIRKCVTKKKKEMSNTLSDYLPKKQNVTKTQSVATATISNPNTDKQSDHTENVNPL